MNVKVEAQLGCQAHVEDDGSSFPQSWLRGATRLCLFVGRTGMLPTSFIWGCS